MKSSVSEIAFEHGTFQVVFGHCRENKLYRLVPAGNPLNVGDPNIVWIADCSFLYNYF